MFMRVVEDADPYGIIAWVYNDFVGEGSPLPKSTGFYYNKREAERLPYEFAVSNLPHQQTNARLQIACAEPARLSAGCRKQKALLLQCFLFSGGATQNRTGDKGVADLCLTAWLWRHIEIGHEEFRVRRFGADYGARTRHLHLGKVALYQMS